MQYDDGRGLPTDFPSDPAYSHFGLLTWGLCGLFFLLFLAVIGAAIIMAYRYGYSTVGREKVVGERVKRVRDALVEAVEGNPDSVQANARTGLQVIEDNFGRTLALAKKVNGARSGLVKALTGVDEEDAKASNLPVQSVAAGATVINIAVNQNSVSTNDPAVIAGPYANVASTPVPLDAKPVKEKMSPFEHEQAVWRALQALLFFWKNPGAKAAFINAQQQVLSSPRWVPPSPPQDAAKAHRVLQ